MYKAGTGLLARCVIVPHPHTVEKTNNDRSGSDLKCVNLCWIERGGDGGDYEQDHAGADFYQYQSSARTPPDM
jgi:hypothetical protein